MKILAIRGCNLASLAGEFEMDLSGGPLGQVGLFAITGPTGAGKSTLLDALCLALFNRTPRLGNQGGVAIGAEGEGGLKDSDPRSLMRRGAVAGFAEVDFLGVDARTYRARWSVRRARQKADGVIQAEDLVFTDLEAGINLSGTKTETLEGISARLGLTFEQFKQSVLLAQGDFAAFLKAKGTERAQLLERMTGTEIYGHISMRAAQKAQDSQNAVAVHEQAMAGFKPLDPEARTALEGAVTELKAKLVDQDALVKELEAGQRWYADLAAKRVKEVAAEAELAIAQTAWDSAQPRRTELEAVRTAQPLRAEVESADAAAKAFQAQTAALIGLEETLGKAQQADAQQATALAAADARLVGAQEALRDAGPDLDSAKSLDTQVKAAAQAAAQKATQASGLDADATAAETQAGALARELAASSGRAQDAQAWLDRHPEVGPLATEWGRWQQELGRYSSAHADVARAGKERPGLVQAVAGAQAAHAATLQAAVAKASLEDHAKEVSAKAAMAASEFDLEALTRDRSALNAHRDRLVALEGVRVVGSLAWKQAAEHRQAQADLAAQILQAQAEIAQGNARRSPLAATVEEAERTARSLDAARSLTDRRAQLVEGEACPLCGATEHPWAQGDAKLADLATAQEARVAELRADLTELDASLKAAQSRAERAAADAKAAAAKAATHETEASKHQLEWSRHIESLDLAWPARAFAGFAAPRAAEAAGAAEAAIAVEAVGAGAGIAAGTAVGAGAGTAAGTAVGAGAGTAAGTAVGAGAGIAAGTAVGAGAGIAAGTGGGTAAGTGAGSSSSLPQDLRDLAANPRLADLQAEAKVALGALDALQAKAQQADKAAKQAAKDYQDALTQSAEAMRGATEAEKALGTATRELQDLDQRLAEAQKKRGEAADALAAAFPSRQAWLSDLQADPDLFRQRCSADVEAWNARLAQRDKANAESAALTPRHAAALASAKAKRDEAAKAGAESSLVAQDLAGKKQARSLLLGALETAVFEAALNDAVANAARIHQEAGGQREAAGKALAAAQASVEHGRQSLQAATSQAGSAAEALAAALEAAGTDLAALRARLVKDKAWIAAEEAATGELARRLTEAQQSFKVLGTQRHEHELSSPPRWPEVEVGPALEGARAGFGDAQQLAGAADGQLKADDQNRDQAARSLEILAGLEAKARLWGSLAAVIGSKDGNKFRRYAQSLTLDALLALANEHLLQLSPRYRLMRVPNASRDTHALELQVIDLDMGDEIRSANTLSGGESFLVSLSLALGLSALAARNTKIDSLFIDEGFGTLDPATLEVALATLDALQAEGRQVGLISHVPGLGDRIGAQIKVEPRGTGRSSVRVVTEMAVGPAPRERVAFCSQPS